MMRLWHQSFTEIDKMPSYKSAMQEHLEKVAAPGTEIVMHGTAPGTHTTKYPGRDISYPYVQDLHSLQFLELADSSVLQALAGMAVRPWPRTPHRAFLPEPAGG